MKIFLLSVLSLPGFAALANNGGKKVAVKPAVQGQPAAADSLLYPTLEGLAK